jgi:hypothetical protein
MVISQKLVQEIDSLSTDKALVVLIDEALPALLRESAQYVVILCVELDVVFVQVLEELVGPENLRDLDQLIRIAVAVEEGLLPEDHRRKHGA